MSEFTPVSRNDGPTAEASPPDPETSTPAEQVTESTVMAVLRGGPAAGRQVLVPRIADTFPIFIGVDGGNYVRDRGTGDTAVYNWWPAGANAPAGDPAARSETR